MKVKRRVLTATLVAALGLALVPTAAGSGAYTYWWQQNMPANVPIMDRTGAHNHTYNELYFGPNAGWRSQVWEVTPAGHRHFDRMCTGNCFFSHPAWFYTNSYCANRDYFGNAHFVNRCMDRW